MPILPGEKLRELLRYFRFRRREKHPEAILNYIQRRIAATNGAFDKVHHRKLRFIQQKTVARGVGDNVVGDKRIGRGFRIVTRQLSYGIVGVDEPLLPAVAAFWRQP